jgi:hypothetical protein
MELYSCRNEKLLMGKQLTRVSCSAIRRGHLMRSRACACIRLMRMFAARSGEVFMQFGMPNPWRGARSRPLHLPPVHSAGARAPAEMPRPARSARSARSAQDALSWGLEGCFPSLTTACTPWLASHDRRWSHRGRWCSRHPCLSATPTTRVGGIRHPTPSATRRPVIESSTIAWSGNDALVKEDHPCRATPNWPTSRPDAIS